MTGDGNEIVFSAGGMVICTATPEQTAAIPYVRGRRYEYDLILRTPTGAVYSLLRGRAVIRPVVTDAIPAPLLAQVTVKPTDDSGSLVSGSPYDWMLK